MALTSTKNPRLQAIRRAAISGRPTEEGLVVIEGPHLLQEVIKSTWQVEEVFVTSEAQDRYGELLESAGVPATEVSRRAIESLASTNTPQNILTLVRPRSWSWTDLLGKAAPILALDGIQDPGNAGTMIRSAEAFGASGVIFLNGSVRSSNGKLLRAAAGSLFRIPFVEGVDTVDLLRHAKESGLFLLALAPGGGVNLEEAKLGCGCVLAVGSEGSGISAKLMSAAQLVSIPTQAVESLNAAVACSIALYIAHQQRKQA